jgi:Spy/CpxP family protein refolding chaperone
MKVKVLFVLLIISVGLNIGFLIRSGFQKTQTEPLSRFQADNHGWHNSFLCRNLELTPEQVKIMEKYRIEVEEQTFPFREELRRKRLELFEFIKNEKIGEAELGNLLIDISTLQVKIEKEFIYHLLTIKKVFTPDQMKKFDFFLKKGLCKGMLSSRSYNNAGKRVKKRPGFSCEKMSEKRLRFKKTDEDKQKN